jgi:hypothetical protein
MYLINNNNNDLFYFIFKDAISIRPTTIQTARAANLACSAFRYRTELDHENIKPVILKIFKKKNFFNIKFLLVNGTKISTIMFKSI